MKSPPLEQNRRPWKWALALSIALLAILGFKIFRPSPAVKDVQNITIAQVGDFFLYAPIYIAVDEGYFREEGLEVNIISTGGDDKTWIAVLSGNAAFGVADPTFVAVSAERGQGGIVVASVVNGVPFWGITYKDIKPFSTNSDLNGFTVATFPAPSTAYTLQSKMFRDAGLNPKIREGAFGGIIPMLKAGTADIGLELEPNVSAAQKNGAKVVYSLAEIYGDFAITGLMTTRQFATANPETVRKTVAAIQKALDSIHHDRQRAIALLAKRFPEIDNEVAASALDRVIKERILPDKTIVSKEAWDKAISLRVTIGDLTKPAPFTTFVDNSFSSEH